MICIILVASLRDRLQRELEAEALRNGNQQDFVHLPRSLLPVDGDDSILDLWWAVISKERSITNVFIVTNAIHYKVRAENHLRRHVRRVSCVRMNLQTTTDDRHPLCTALPQRVTRSHGQASLAARTCVASRGNVRRSVCSIIRRFINDCRLVAFPLSHTLTLSLTYSHSHSPPLLILADQHFERWATAHGLPVENVINDGITDETRSLGAARDLQLGLQRASCAKNEDVLVVAGDSMFYKEFDLRGVLNFFKTKAAGDSGGGGEDAAAGHSLALYYKMAPGERAEHRGVVEVETKTKRITSFREKPKVRATVYSTTSTRIRILAVI